LLAFGLAYRVIEMPKAESFYEGGVYCRVTVDIVRNNGGFKRVARVNLYGHMAELRDCEGFQTVAAVDKVRGNYLEVVRSVFNSLWIAVNKKKRKK